MTKYGQAGWWQLVTRFHRHDEEQVRQHLASHACSGSGRKEPPNLSREFSTVIGEEIVSKIIFVCSDMWEQTKMLRGLTRGTDDKPVLPRIRPDHMSSLMVDILDRFHIVASMNKALDEVRAGESRRMASEGFSPGLNKSRWLLLKREENLKIEQRFQLRELLRY